MLLSLFFAIFFSNFVNILSPTNKSNPPDINPIVTIIHGIILRLSAILRAGSINEKKEAAIMIPAAIPSMASMIFFLTFLKKNTIAAPRMVIL